MSNLAKKHKAREESSGSEQFEAGLKNLARKDQLRNNEPSQLIRAISSKGGISEVRREYFIASITIGHIIKEHKAGISWHVAIIDSF